MGVYADFIDYLKVKRRYSPRTVKLYGEAVEAFFRHAFPEKLLGDISLSLGNTDILASRERVNTGFIDEIITEGELTEVLRFQIIRGYVSFLMDRGLDPRTVNLHLSALSSFCNFLVRQKKLASNPVREVVRPKEKKRLPSFFSPEVLKQYFDTPVADGYPSVRNRMIVTLIFDTGLRRAEAASLRISNIDLNRGIVSVIGKGNKQRFVPIVASLREKIGDYLLLRDEFLKSLEVKPSATLKKAADSFFLTDAGGPPYPEFINRVVKAELSGVKGLSGKKTPHTLRNSFATSLLNAGADLNSIKEALGHSSLAATEVYTHNSFEKLKEIYKTAHPRAKNNRL